MKLTLIAAFAGIVAMAAAYAEPNPYAFAEAEPYAEPEAYAEADVLAGYEEGFLAARDLYARHARNDPRPVRQGSPPAKPKGRHHRREAKNDPRPVRQGSPPAKPKGRHHRRQYYEY
ncbi:hypothetical protein MMC26_004895 [Xylographa opegraphella]|nr:hypothetical protein [Xylographa opegraphella]